MVDMRVLGGSFGISPRVALTADVLAVLDLSSKMRTYQLLLYANNEHSNKRSLR